MSSSSDTSLGPKPDDWCRAYATASCRLKKCGDAALETANKAIQDAHAIVYRSVAFDVDGTLTLPGTTDIDPQMADVIFSLLRRGVPVLMITGRGRTGAREAANKLRGYATTSPWCLRRLRCITHNGVFMLSTPDDDPAKFLSLETLLIEPFRDVNLHMASIGRLQGTFTEIVECMPEPHSVRIKLKACASDALIKAIHGVTGTVPESLHISRGTFGAVHALDVGPTNKSLALVSYASKMGIQANQILRIGDHGARGGNDFDVLNALSGFSVNALSDDATTCHPILDDSLKTQLNGAAATAALINRVMLFPPLSLSEPLPRDRLLSLLRFQELAKARSRVETNRLMAQLQSRLTDLMGSSEDKIKVPSLELGDLFDSMSGAVRLLDHEIPELVGIKPFNTLFLGDRDPWGNGPPRFPACMYTDTAMLLRGPFYYGPMVDPKMDVPKYLADAQAFLRSCLGALPHLAKGAPTIVRLKLLLGVFDNIRNCLIVTSYCALQAASKDDALMPTFARLTELCVKHTELHFRLLMESAGTLRGAISEYCSLLQGVERAFEEATAELRPHFGMCEIRKWREADNFLENVLAIKLAFEEWRKYQDLADPDEIVGLSLVYGGIELASIAKVVGARQNIKVSLGFLGLSLYGDEKTGADVRAGGADYVRQILSKSVLPTVFDDDWQQVTLKNRRVVLLDDNCTTCGTLQNARDIAVLQGANVVGAVAVRSPGINRFVQMDMTGHGHPDPEMLFTVIRGLISPSPYARIFEQDSTGKYLDVTGNFDNAKDRITRYLKKNIESKK